MGTSYEGGYTIIELLVVIILLGIFTALIVFTPANFQESGDDQERADDVASIARRLEMAYSYQDLGTPSYPSTAEFSADLTSKTRTATRLSPDALKAPGSTTNSVVGATSASSTAPISGDITTSQYVYQPLMANGNLCTATNSTSSTSAYCVRFILYYRSAANQSVKKVISIHQQ